MYIWPWSYLLTLLLSFRHKKKDGGALALSLGRIRTRLGVGLRRLTSSQLHLLLVRSHQAEIIIVKRLIQGRNNVTRVEVEPKSCDHSSRKNDAFTLSATLPIRTHCNLFLCGIKSKTRERLFHLKFLSKIKMRNIHPPFFHSLFLRIKIRFWG